MNSKMERRGGTYLLIGLLLVFVIVDIGVATWLLTPPHTRRYVVLPGETLADIAEKFQVHEQVIMEENELRPGSAIHSGLVLSIPLSRFGPLLRWDLQLIGVAGTVLGVLLSFWLARRSGLAPVDARLPVLAIALAVAVAHYVMSQISSSEVPAGITPLFVLASIVDGFAWSTLLLLISRALGSSAVSD
jgi:LysM repeat protein